MRKQTPALEWHVVENDAEWERQQALLVPTATPATGYRLHRQKQAGSLVALLLLLAMGGAWWRQSFQAGTHQAQVTATTAAPALATAASAPAELVASIEHNPTLWGLEESLATPYFLYHFRQQDAASVRAVAPVVDAIYTTLWRNLGLPIKPMPDKLVIAVRVEQLLEQTPVAFDTQRSLSVPSPAHYLAPVALGDVDLLAQSIALPLLAHGLAQARAHHQIGPAWQPLLDGFYLWQVWDLDLPLATWRETVVQWQYRDLPATEAGQLIRLPERYQELCAAHKRWLQSPVQLYIPLLCAGRNQEDGHWHAWRAAAPLTHLAQLAVPLPMNGREGATVLIGPPLYTNHPGQTVALTTLIAYTVQTHGQEALPLLLAELGDATSWETLLPAAFGVSTAEFEAGWQAYLMAHYGVATQP
ncbi:MAG: hypothetical protein ACOYNY_07350 [Caldilineaceae bacterium]